MNTQQVPDGPAAASAEHLRLDRISTVEGLGAGDVAGISDYLRGAHHAQSSLLSERRLAEDRAWVWTSHAQLIASMGQAHLTVPTPPGPASPRVDRGLFAATAEHARANGLTYCEGFRFPHPYSSGAATGSQRHAWCRRPSTGEITDLAPGTQGQAWCYLGLGFDQGVVDWFENHQPGHLPVHDNQAQPPMPLDEALARTLSESLDEPLPLPDDTSGGKFGYRADQTDPERTLAAFGSPGQAPSQESVDPAVAIRYLHEQVAKAADGGGGRQSASAPKSMWFMGIFDHVGPGVECLRLGLLLRTVADAPSGQGLGTEVGTPVVCGFGDPPPF